MLRLILDTDVVVAGMRSPEGASAAILKAARFRQIEILATVSVMLEYEAVCTRGKHIEASGLSATEVKGFLNALAMIVEPIEPYFLWRARLPDPNDELVLEAAVNGGANAIVTFNTRHFGSVPNEFGIEVWKPRDVLGRMRV